MNNSDLAVAISRVSKNLDSGCQIVKTRGALRPLILGFTADGRGISFFFDTSDPDQVQDELDMARAILCLNNCVSYLLISEEQTGLRFTGTNTDLPSALTNGIHQFNAVMAFYVCDSGVLWGLRQFRCDPQGQIIDFYPPNILDQFDDTLMHSWMSNLLDHSLVTDEYRSLAQRAMEVASFRFTPVAH